MLFCKSPNLKVDKDTTKLAYMRAAMTLIAFASSLSSLDNNHYYDDDGYGLSYTYI